MMMFSATVTLACRVLVAGVLVSLTTVAAAGEAWNVFSGGDGPGKGKQVVLVSGDEEYRSEEALTQLAKILAGRHGFHCTVLYAIDPESGEIAPNEQKNIPGLEALRDADLMVIATRFRNLPDGQMKEIDDYLKSGRPVIGMRTATHGFNMAKDSPYAHYSFNYRGEKKEWTQGFGRLVLGETWINHHGRHKFESTRGIIAPGAESHPILRGIKDGDIWGPTDVYGVRLPLPGDSQPLVLGQVLSGMEPDSTPVAAPPESLKKTINKVDKNDPMMPVAWVKSYSVDGGPSGRVFTTTMGASIDMESAGVRRLLVNACYWAAGLEESIGSHTDAAIVGDFEPTMYGFRKEKTAGITPADFVGGVEKATAVASSSSKPVMQSSVAKDELDPSDPEKCKCDCHSRRGWRRRRLRRFR
jgi:type 1 glutamine amidotransferase